MEKKVIELTRSEDLETKGDVMIDEGAVQTWAFNVVALSDALNRICDASKKEVQVTVESHRKLVLRALSHAVNEYCKITAEHSITTHKIKKLVSGIVEELFEDEDDDEEEEEEEVTKNDSEN